MASTGQGLLGNNMFAYCKNNPICFSDYSGLAARGSTTVVVEDGCSGHFGGSIGPVFPLPMPGVISTIEELVDEIKVWVKSASSPDERRDQHVYVLLDSDNNVRYVGRTNDPHRRYLEHINDPWHPERKEYSMTVLLSGLTLDEARVWEQVLISAFSLAYLENARREIAVGNIKKF